MFIEPKIDPRIGSPVWAFVSQSRHAFQVHRHISAVCIYFPHSNNTCGSTMSELINFILNHEESFKSKNRLISLYSDFSALKSSNPDGYRANVSAWTSALTNAARAGLLPGSSRLCVRVDSTLSSELEVRNVGRPVALDAVLVRQSCLSRILDSVN